jgi:hypothetical protein
MSEKGSERKRSGSSLMMEAIRTSETSVDNHFTRQYIPEDNSVRSGVYLTVLTQYFPRKTDWNFNENIRPLDRDLNPGLA